MLIAQSLKVLEHAGSAQQVQSSKTMVKSSLARPLLPLSSLLSQKDVLSIALKPKWKLNYLRLFFVFSLTRRPPTQ